MWQVNSHKPKTAGNLVSELLDPMAPEIRIPSSNQRQTISCCTLHSSYYKITKLNVSIGLTSTAYNLLRLGCFCLAHGMARGRNRNMRSWESERLYHLSALTRVVSVSQLGIMIFVKICTMATTITNCGFLSLPPLTSEALHNSNFMVLLSPLFTNV